MVILLPTLVDFNNSSEVGQAKQPTHVMTSCLLNYRFMAMPSGAREVPSGQLSLTNIVLGVSCLSFVVFGGARVSLCGGGGVRGKQRGLLKHNYQHWYSLIVLGLDDDDSHLIIH